ncbi:MAG: Rieske 2Fe-2S domain-containing protein [Proteobacteria bacterium]|nr:Rieske 2Fe-2S domain-containing protein [Pseudomonadota bacterium]
MTRAATLHTLPLPAIGAGLRAQVREHPVALFNVGGVLYAIEDGCLRCGTSLAGGMLAARVVTCRQCGWRYDLADGSVLGLDTLKAATYTAWADGTHARISLDGGAARRR